MDSDVKHTDNLWRAAAWLDAHRRQAIFGAIAVLAIGLVVYVVIWQHQQKEAAADAALSKLTSEQIAGQNQAPPSAESLLTVARQHSGTDASVRALLLAASTMFAEGKYAEAQAQFEKFTREHSQSPFLPQALLGVAASQHALGKTNEAIIAYLGVVKRFPKDAVTPQAKFALANLYEAQGKNEEARNFFEEVAREDPFGSIGSEAGMRSEELLKKHPELAPKPAAATNLPSLPPLAPTLPATQPATNVPTSPTATN